MMQKRSFCPNKSDGDETLGTESRWVGDNVVETAARKGAGRAITLWRAKLFGWHRKHT